MDQRKINRINELAKKAKTLEGLTEEEMIERTILRREYIDAVTGNLRAQLDNTYIVDERGSRSKARFDQGGVILYLDSENWIKASVEYENERIQRLGSVVTNNGYSDWATVDVDASLKSAWFRLSRREDDYCLEYSPDGEEFHQMRICHLFRGGEGIRFGVYACSPEESSFEARFSHLELTECLWKAHDGQQPDAE